MAATATTSFSASSTTHASSGAADFMDFAEQLQGFQSTSSATVARTPGTATSIRASRGGAPRTTPSEPADHTTDAAMLAALLSGLPGTATPVLPAKLHLTGDSLPAVEEDDAVSVAPDGQTQLAAGATPDAPQLAATATAAGPQLAAAATATGPQLAATVTPAGQAQLAGSATPDGQAQLAATVTTAGQAQHAATATPDEQLQLATAASAIAAQAIAAQLGPAPADVQQPALALQDLLQSQAAQTTAQTAAPASPLPAVPAEAVSATSPDATELAFAVRLKPAPAAAGVAADSQRSSESAPRITAIHELRRSELDNEQKQNTELPPAQHATNPATHTFITSDGPATAAPVDKPEAAAAPRTTAVTPEAAPVKSAEPLKELNLQVSGPNQDRVDVRIVDHGGELHVAVRTGSTDLAHGLREGISDLVGRLQETGFRTDTWRPVHAATPVSAASGPQQSATEFRNPSDSQPNSGGSQQQSREQREQQPSNRPSWVEELEGSLTPAGEPTPGEKHGLFR